MNGQLPTVVGTLAGRVNPADLIFSPPTWTREANCNDLPPGEADRLFFDFPGRPPLKEIEMLCGPCPVRQACVSQGQVEEFGVWGGVNSSTRSRGVA